MTDDDSVVTEEASKKTGFRFAGVLAGIGSGLTKVAVGHGFDTIKTRMQCSPPGMYNGAIDCFMKTVRNEGVLAVYKGASPPAIGWAAADSVLLGSLHNYRLFLLHHGPLGIVETGDITIPESKRLSILGHAVAGWGAGCTSAFIAQPIELLKVNLQLQRQRTQAGRKFKGPIDVARQVIAARGVFGLWRGLSTNLLFRSSFFWMFGSVEVYMRLFGRLAGTPYEMSTGLSTFTAGGLSAFTFWAFGIPIDNVKNRILSAPFDSPPMRMKQVVRSIYASQGWRGFYTGFGPVVVRAFPVNAAAYFVYETIMKNMGAEKTRH